MIPFPKRSLLTGRKAVMGIGMLFIFVATVIASSIAAAVLISATESIQERAYIVQEEATERLLSGFDVVAVYLEANTTTSTIDKIEIIVRLRSGSRPIEIDNIGFSYISNDVSLSALLNESKMNDDCTFDDVAEETEFCMKQFFSSNSTIMQTGDMASFLFKLSSDNAMTTDQDFTLILQPPLGASQVLELQTPDLILAAKIKVR